MAINIFRKYRCQALENEIASFKVKVLPKDVPVPIGQLGKKQEKNILYCQKARMKILKAADRLADKGSQHYPVGRYHESPEVSVSWACLNNENFDHQSPRIFYYDDYVNTLIEKGKICLWKLPVT